MIINATSHTMRKVWILFLFIFIFTTILFIALTQGIRIESLQLPKVKIEQLYIKLDKKLIVSAEKVNIEISSKSETSISEIKNLVDKLPYLHALFKSISIQNLILDNKTIHFLYKNEVFYIDSDFLVIDAKIRTWNKELELVIEHAILKDYNIDLRGNLQANLSEKIFNFQGSFSTFNIDGSINLKIDKQELFYRLSTKEFSTLKPFMDFLSKKINLDPLIAGWIYKKIVAKKYTLNNLEGMFNFKNNTFSPKLMKAKATTKSVLIKFDPNVPAATVRKMIIILDNNQLIFKTKEAIYESKIVENPNIYIYNLMTKGPGIIIDIKANTALDNSIHKILKAFEINVPITQLKGKTKSTVKLDIFFDPLDVRDYTGSFELKDSNINISGLALYSKSAKIILDNDMIHIKHANLKYANLFDIDTSGILDIEKQVYQANNTINSLHVDFEAVELIDIKDLNSSATMYLNDKQTKISIDKLKTTLEFNNIDNNIIIDDLSILYPYSKLMQELEINKGKTTINTKDFENFEAIANIKNINLPLQKNGKKIKNIDALITTNGKNLDISSKDKKIEISYDGELKVNIKDIDVEFDSSKMESSNEIKQIKIIGINSNIIDINSSFKLPSEKFTYEVKDKNSTFTTNQGIQKLELIQSKNNLYLSSEDLSDKYVNSIFGKNAFKNGKFEINLFGKDFNDLEGSFLLKATTIKDLKFFNNLMAFINTIPALVTLQNPEFNEEGYEVNEGVISFLKLDNIIKIKEITLIGKSADIIGNGHIDLETGHLVINLKIAILKGISSIVDKIPLVGYIILGEDGKIYTSVNIKGTLDKPEINTNVISDTALSPFKILKRTLELPFKIFQ